jgi:hypothetical protein
VWWSIVGSQLLQISTKPTRTPLIVVLDSIDVVKAGAGRIDSYHRLWDCSPPLYLEFSASPQMDRSFRATNYDAANLSCGIRTSIYIDAASHGAPPQCEIARLPREIQASQQVSDALVRAPIREISDVVSIVNELIRPR